MKQKKKISRRKDAQINPPHIPLVKRGWGDLFFIFYQSVGVNEKLLPI